LSLTLEVGDENITITDKGDNVMTFPLVSETPTEDAPAQSRQLQKSPSVDCNVYSRLTGKAHFTPYGHPLFCGAD